MMQKAVGVVVVCDVTSYERIQGVDEDVVVMSGKNAVECEWWDGDMDGSERRSEATLGIYTCAVRCQAHSVDKPTRRTRESSRMVLNNPTRREKAGGSA